MPHHAIHSLHIDTVVPVPRLVRRLLVPAVIDDASDHGASHEEENIQDGNRRREAEECSVRSVMTGFAQERRLLLELDPILERQIDH